MNISMKLTLVFVIVALLPMYSIAESELQPQPEVVYIPQEKESLEQILGGKTVHASDFSKTKKLITEAHTTLQEYQSMNQRTDTVQEVIVQLKTVEEMYEDTLTTALAQSEEKIKQALKEL